MESWITESDFFGGWEGQFILAIKAFQFSWEIWSRELGEGKGERGSLNFLLIFLNFFL